MKRPIEQFGEINDKYIKEADPARTNSPIFKRAAIFAAACLLVLLTSVNLFLFIPYDTSPPDVSQYSDSDYYEIIKMLNDASYKKPKYKNNFESICGTLLNGLRTKNDMSLGFDVVVDEAVDANGNAGEDYFYTSDEYSEKYVETTDNQVAGVIEADIIKRSNEHVYYLNDSTLLVYTLNGKDSELATSYDMSKALNEDGIYLNGAEMFLSSDCKTVTVIAPYFLKIKLEGGSRAYAGIDIISIDVSDLSDVKVSHTATINGAYVGARSTNGKLLLISCYEIPSDYTFEEEESFIPTYYVDDETHTIPAESIVIPEKLTSKSYTVVSMLDEKSLKLESANAMLSYSSEVYITTERVYATYSYTKTKELVTLSEVRSITDISALSYSGGELVFLGTATVNGYIKDQYSLDEYKDVLRVVTTTNDRKEKIDTSYSSNMISVLSEQKTSASLYCIDADTFKIISSVEYFAPIGETVRSVRFDGDIAYVCTAVQATDPVFFFDLSDVNNITYKDTGNIEGFSSSLVNFGDGLLLGIGEGARSDVLKLEVYAENEDSVESLAKIEINGCGFSRIYKSYFIDRELSIIGIATNDFSKNTHYYYSHYRLFRYDSEGLSEILVCDIPTCDDPGKVRAVYEDGYIYVFSNEGFTVKEIALEVPRA